jgi:uncharacterized cysteine cluster protein YcgN (CxxCxxCC family)
MTQLQLKIAADQNNPLSERHNFVITSATGIAKSACSITIAQIEIGSWKGEHSFIISGAVTKHEMIIVRDFFKQNKVIVNHANDSIKIDEMQININTICSISTKPTFDDKEYFNTNEIDYSQLILTRFSELQKDIAEYKTASDKIYKAFIEPIENNETINTKTIETNLTTITVEHEIQSRQDEPTATETTLIPTTTTTNELIDNINCKVKSRHHHSCSNSKTRTIVQQHRLSITNTLMFEPIQPFPKGCLVARSLNSKDSDNLYCNVINSSDEDIILKQNQEIGHLCEAEIAEEQFEDNVKRYVPLITTKLIHFSGKKCSSKPVNEVEDGQQEITTADIINHEMKHRLKQLQTGKSLSSEQRVLLLKRLEKNVDVFQWNPNEIGRTKLVEHKIPTGNAAPIQKRQYPIPSVARDNMKDQVANMLEK